ncbi:MAG: CPBP family intramembrane metalloprotease [Myxococcaceae bacterium]|nr:CPBP family intramembrane metalloprotease [Myxococcaceae bacterium]MCI0671307.1 CPBP family intramembrane metalloprotease [Myxococcaceae bacterium]
MLRRILRHPFTCLVLTVVLLAVLNGALLALVQLVAGGRLSALGPLQRSLGVDSPVNALAATVALLAVGRGLERKTPEGLGLGTRGMGRDLLRGVAVGAALMTAVVGVLALLGWYRLVEGPPETAQEETLEAFGYVVGFLFAGYFEEVLFRGIGFRLLEEWLGSGAALLLSSAFFGLVHGNNPDATWSATVGIALEAGLLLGAAFMLTRSLWFATGIHWAWNWVQGPLFGVDVSGMTVDGVLESALVGPVAWTGGAFGAEAGGVAVLLCTAAGVALTLLAVHRGQWRPFLSWRRQRRALAPSPAA